MRSPIVSFIVPCYKLAHLLPDCVNSILAQTYDNFEVLIMDDCSPDNTAQVARSFRDARVKHIRNDPNVGHLRNYNKGIGLAAGRYVWLISADDCLRKPYVLERYLEVMEAHPEVGYAFCPGVGLQGQRETEIVEWAVLDHQDAILNGREFLCRLLQANCVLAPSGLVRKECYERLGTFPLDLPFAGDWYLWCMFALYYDVAYFCEAMVNYREHSQSMTDLLIAEDIRLLSRDDVAVRWRMKEQIERAGHQSLAERCKDSLVEYYIQSMTSKRWRGARYRMSLEELNLSLNTHASKPHDRTEIQTRVLAGIGDRLYWDKDFEPDLRIYKLALEHSPANPKLWLKYLVLRFGALGTLAMHTVSTVRGATRRLLSKG